MQHAVRNARGIAFNCFCSVFLLLAAVSSAGCKASAQGEPGGASASGIVGLVTDETGAPVPGAEVAASLWIKEFPILLPHEARVTLRTETDSQGWYCFAGVERGIYMVVARGSDGAMGIAAGPGGAWLQDDTSRVRVDLTLEGAKLTGGVVVDAAGNPVAGATVVARDTHGDTWAAELQEGFAEMVPVTTDAAGRFAHGFIPSQVEVRAAGFAPTLFALNIGREDNVLTLTAGATVTGVVRDASGDAAPGATVVARPEVGRNATATCDENGVFVLANLAPGIEYELAAEAGERRSCEPVRLTLSDGETGEGVSLALCDGAVIAGRVYASDTGRPFADCHVRLETKERRMEALEATTDVDGRYSFPPLPAGEYNVTCIWPSSALQKLSMHDRSREGTKSQQVRAESGRTAAADFTFEQGTFVAGRVTDADGKPVAGARIEAGNGTEYIEGGETIGSGKTVSGQDGRYTVWGLLPNVGGHLGVTTPGYSPLGLKFDAPGKGLNTIDVVLTAGSSISGVVVDRGGAPLAYAELEARAVASPNPSQEVQAPGQPVPTVTDAEGRFAFDGLPAGQYAFSVVTRDPSRTLTRAAENPPVEVDAGQRIKDLELVVPAPMDNAFRGVVRDSEGKPLAGVYVKVPQRYGSLYPFAMVRTNEEGEYALGGLGEDTRDLEFELEGYARARLTGLEPDSSNDVVLEKYGSIRGTVIDAATEEPVKGTNVKVERVRTRYGEEGGGGEAVDLGPNAAVGAFAFAKVMPGQVTLKVSAPGYVEQEAPAITLPGGGEANDVTVSLEPAAIIEGTITREGKPLRDFEQWITVYTTDAEKKTVAGGGYNVNEGKYRFDTLPAGEYLVEANVRGPGGEWHPSEKVKAEAGKTATVNFEIP